MTKQRYTNVGLQLSATIASQLEDSTTEQLSILEELAALRAFVHEAVALYGAAIDAREEKRASGEEVSDKLNAAVFAAGQMMADCLDRVKGMASEAARIEATLRQTFDRRQMRVVAHEFIKMIYDVCGTQYSHVAEEFEGRIKEELSYASPDFVGTTLTPDQDVQAMNSTIPALPEPDDTPDDDDDRESIIENLREVG